MGISREHNTTQTGGRYAYMFKYTYAGIRIINMYIEREDRHMSRVTYITSTVPQVWIEFTGKEEREQKGGYECKTTQRSQHR